MSSMLAVVLIGGLTPNNTMLIPIVRLRSTIMVSIAALLGPTRLPWVLPALGARNNQGGVAKRVGARIGSAAVADTVNSLIRTAWGNWSGSTSSKVATSVAALVAALHCWVA